MNKLQQLFSPGCHDEIWLRLKSKLKNNSAVGIDGVSTMSFKANFEAWLKSTSVAIRTNEYNFSSLKPFAVEKGNDEIRLINIPTIQDKYIQRVILDFFKWNYSEAWKTPNSFTSMGIDGEGSHAMLMQISKKVAYEDHIIKADLSKYFDTMDRGLLKEVVRQKVRHRSLHPLIYKMIDCETDVSQWQRQAIFAKSKLSHGKGIRQGMPISPVLAYLYLADVDQKHSTGLFRYVDDLLFTGVSQTEVISKFENYKKMAEEKGLSIHKLDGNNSKTQYIPPKQNFEFLGLNVVRRAEGIVFNVPSVTKDKVKERLNDLAKFPEKKKEQEGWAIKAINRTAGLVRDYHTAYGICEDWDKFETFLREHRVSMCRKIAKEICNINRNENSKVLLRAFGAKD